MARSIVQPAVIDELRIAFDLGQRVEDHEITTYGTLATWAELMGPGEAEPADVWAELAEEDARLYVVA
jgi:ferritin-like metal-binding protein YciE